MAQGLVIQGYFPGGPRISTAPTVQPRTVHPQTLQPQVPRPAARNASPPLAHQQRTALPHVAQPRGVHPQSVPTRRATPQGPVVQRVGNGEAFQLPTNLSNFGGGAGQPLPGPVLRKMESFFNTSFKDVRVHVGPQASSIGALAFTQGSNLHFAPGQYNPNTAQGLQLLGHELTHVVQQRAGRVRNPFGSGVAVVQDRGMEAEADRMGLLAATRPTGGAAVAIVQSKAIVTPPGLIQREIIRGSNTGWGFPYWVEGGKDLWTELDGLFNKQLLGGTSPQESIIARIEKMQNKEPLISHIYNTVLEKLKKIKNDYDTKAIYHDIYVDKNNPSKSQALSASQIRNDLKEAIVEADKLLKNAKSAKKSIEKTISETRSSYLELRKNLKTMREMEIGKGDSQSNLTNQLEGVSTNVEAQIKGKLYTQNLLEGFQSSVSELEKEFGVLEERFSENQRIQEERESRKKKATEWGSQLANLLKAIGNFPLLPSEWSQTTWTNKLDAYGENASLKQEIEKKLEETRKCKNLCESAKQRGWGSTEWNEVTKRVNGNALAFILEEKTVAEYKRIKTSVKSVANVEVGTALGTKEAWENAIKRMDFIENGEGCRDLTLRWVNDITFEHTGTYRAQCDVKDTDDYHFRFSRKYVMSLGTRKTIWEMHIHYSIGLDQHKTPREGAAYIHFTTTGGSTNDGRTNPVASKGYEPVLQKLKTIIGPTVRGESLVQSQASSHKLK